MLQAIGWLIATILLLFLEASTFNLVSVWFAAGSAAALVSCLFTDSLRVQSAVFMAVSILCLLALRPLVKKLAIYAENVKKIELHNVQIEGYEGERLQFANVGSFEED